MIRLSPDVGQAIHYLIAHARKDGMKHLPDVIRSVDWDTVLDAIQQQAENPDHGADLVDVISGHLMNGQMRGGIVGDHLRRFQKAVLLPSELAKMKAAGEGRPTCRGCKRELTQYEMVSVTHDRQFYCSACDFPTQVAVRTSCSRHRDQGQPMVQIPIKAVRAIRKAQKEHGGGVCQGCKHEQEAREQQAQQTVIIRNQPEEGAEILDNGLSADLLTTTGDVVGAPEVTPATTTFRNDGGDRVAIPRRPTFSSDPDSRLPAWRPDTTASQNPDNAGRGSAGGESPFYGGTSTSRGDTGRTQTTGSASIGGLQGQTRSGSGQWGAPVTLSPSVWGRIDESVQMTAQEMGELQNEAIQRQARQMLADMAEAQMRRMREEESRARVREMERQLQADLARPSPLYTINDSDLNDDDVSDLRFYDDLRDDIDERDE